jgi:TonB family protein
MKVDTSRFLCLFILVLGCGLPCTARRENQAAAELIAKAKQIMDIRAPGSPPFRLTEHLRALSSTGGWEEGDYTLIWGTLDRWRDEITFADFHEIRFAREGKVWSLRNQRFGPAIPMRVRLLSNWSSALPLPKSYERLGRIRDSGEGQKVTRCVRLTGPWSLTAELCFDVNQGYFLRQSTHFNGVDEETLLNNYVPLGQHLIPKEYRSGPRGRSTLEVIVTEAEILPAVDPSQFEFPAGANVLATCEAPTEPRPLQKPDPSYTKEARAHKIQGVVVLDVDINETGGVERVNVVKPLDPGLDEAAAQIIRTKWRFEPATCGADAVPVEVMVEVSFRLF